jgi:protein-arginine kinase activator protein McsA
VICEECHQNEAEYRLTSKKDGTKVLCEECAEQYRPELSGLSEGEQFELLHKLDDEEADTQTKKWVVPKNNPPEIPPP